MIKRLPLALTLALATVACNGQQPGGAGSGAVPFDKKVQKVEQLTKALSLTQNAELKQAATSMSTLGSSMSQGGFSKATSAAGGLVAAGGGNIVAAGGGNVMVNNAGNYALTALVEDLNAGLRQDVYGLMGTMDGGNGSTVTYDDETGELTGVSDGKTEATFKFVNGGSKRTWTIDIKKSPDGTTGTMTFEVSADVWKAAPAPQQPTQPATDDDQWFGDEDPLPGDDGEPSGEDDQADAGFDGTGGEDDVAGDDGGFGLQQAQPQLKVFNNEVPDPATMTAVRFACDLTPQGDAKLRVKIDAAVDDVKATKLGRIPTHLKLNLTVPTLQFTSDTNFDAETVLASKGGLKVRTEETTESLKYDLDLRIAEATGKMNLVHEGAKVRIGVVVPKAKAGQPPVPTTALFDTENEQKIADLEASKTEQGILLIKFTNGKTVRWDVASGTTLAVPGAGPTTRPTAAPRPSAKK